MSRINSSSIGGGGCAPRAGDQPTLAWIPLACFHRALVLGSTRLKCHWGKKIRVLRKRVINSYTLFAQQQPARMVPPSTIAVAPQARPVAVNASIEGTDAYMIFSRLCPGSSKVFSSLLENEVIVIAT